MNKESIIRQLKRLSAENNLSIEDDVLSKAVELARFKVYTKGSVIKTIGNKAESVAIVLDGLVRGYYIDQDGNDITRGFAANGGLCMDEGVMGYEKYICVWEPLEESTLMLFDVSDFKSLIMSSEDLKTLWIKLLEEGVRYKMYRENGFLVENATERYLHFRRLYPKLCERIPRKHIATYLGITPESLSRIRKAMKEEELF